LGRFEIGGVNYTLGAEDYMLGEDEFGVRSAYTAAISRTCVAGFFELSQPLDS
jgi:hypothetical protein